MAYSTDPVHDAGVYYDALYARQEREDEHEEAWAQEWLAAALRSTATPAEWMPRGAEIVERGIRRKPTMAESMLEMTDYGDHAVIAMDLIAQVAREGNKQARTLLESMARQWASLYAPELED